ncbi:PAS domain-containing protein [Sphingomonas endophytica]|nr:PAS domain-containing protein [Sphingomonas endophytica]
MSTDSDRNRGTPASAMAALVESHDWSATPLGDRAGWPVSLRNTVAMMLASRHAMCLAWGPSLTFLYNDAYAGFLGPRHPMALGDSLPEVWWDVWPDIKPLLEAALAGQATWSEDLHLVMERNGVPEDTWWSFSYSPLYDDDGNVAGMIDIVSDMTTKVQVERRQAFHLRLEHALRTLADPQEVQAVAARLLGEHLGAQRVTYAEDNGDGRTATVTRGYVDGVPAMEGLYRYDEFSPELAPLLRTGKPVFCNDTARYLKGRRDLLDTCARLQIGATLNVPLVKDEQLVAQLAIHYRAPHPFLPTEIALAGEVAERTWAAVERAKVHVALRESEARYRTLFEALDAGFAVVEMVYDDDGQPLDYRFVEVNPAFEKQTGLTGAPGRLARDLVPGLERHWAETYGHVARTGDPVRFENGSDAMGRWFDVHALRVGDPAQHRVAILFNDISARRAAEQQLRSLNERLEQQVAERTIELRRFRDVVDATTSPICAFDLDGRVVAFNKAQSAEFKRVFGVDVRVGDDLAALLPEDQGPVIRAMMARALAGETYTVIEEFGDPDLAKPYWQVTYTPLRDEAGDVVGAFHLAVDITGRLRAETELAAAQEALRQSQKMEAMGSLTGGVAHDFNNLLTPIFGSLDLLQRRGLGGEREQRLIAGAIQSAERAKTLVQRLLAFARRQPLQPMPVDVSALVAGMADLVASTSGPQTRVIVDGAEGLPAAFADPNQLEMAILNLCVNARDAMPDGGRLTMTTRAATLTRGHPSGLPAGRYICLSVADTGTGMDADTLNRAVEPFFSTKGIGKGTGLGLSMVHGLAAQLGGALTIDSEVGLGTDIRLWLPATDERSVATPRNETTGNTLTAGLALVVDDEPAVRASTADMMIDLGFEVVEAASAEDALSAVGHALSPDVLVTDHLMPGMNGTDLARELRRRRPALRVLIVSGYADVESVAPDLPRLVKPFRQAELAAALSEAGVVTATPA